MGIGDSLKFITRNPAPRNRAHNLPDSTDVTVATAAVIEHPGTGNGRIAPDEVEFAKAVNPIPPTMVPVSGL